ncbi:MAG: hypothetical protein HUU54_09925 [Ignavibacteriaceae bacterium]|nr:hypothetical protein [Ignavibacteriaceae bacterium]
MKKYVLVLLSIYSLLFYGCKEESNPTNQSNPTNFSLIFTNNRIRGEGWVILHSLDGKQNISYKSFNKNGNIDFGDIKSDRVSFTYIERYTTSSGWKNVNITTDLNAPAGEWRFEGNYYDYRGKLTINSTFPADYYKSGCDAVLYNGSSGYNFGSSLIQNRSTTRDIYYLKNNKRISVISSVILKNVDSAYYGMAENTPFVENTTNVVNLAVNNRMAKKVVSFNQPVQYYFCAALQGDSLDYMGMSYLRENTAVSSIPVYYIPSVPKKYYYLSGGYSGTTFGRNFTIIGSDLPSSVTIPDMGITGTYVPDSAMVTGINISGVCDQISANWVYTNSAEKTTVSWLVYAPHNSLTIKRPGLPAEVTSQIPEYNAGQLILNSVGMVDYDTFTSMDDIVKAFFKSYAPQMDKYKTSFSYYKVGW